MRRRAALRGRCASSWSRYGSGVETRILDPRDHQRRDAPGRGSGLSAATEKLRDGSLLAAIIGYVTGITGVRGCVSVSSRKRRRRPARRSDSSSAVVAVGHADQRSPAARADSSPQRESSMATQSPRIEAAPPHSLTAALERAAGTGPATACCRACRPTATMAAKQCGQARGVEHVVDLVAQRARRDRDRHRRPRRARIARPRRETAPSRRAREHPCSSPPCGDERRQFRVASTCARDPSPSARNTPTSS